MTTILRDRLFGADRRAYCESHLEIGGIRAIGSRIRPIHLASGCSPTLDTARVASYASKFHYVPSPKPRQPDHIRQVECCVRCGKRALGVTTVEHRPWDKERPEHRFHFCDPCSDAIILRPIDQVLLEFLT